MALAIGEAIFAGVEALGAAGAAGLGAQTLFGTSLTVAGLVGNVAVVGGLVAAQSLLTPKGPTPEQQHGVINQAVGPRVRIYGQAMVGGTRAFWDARNGNLYQAIMLASDRIDSFVAYYIGDIAVSIDGAGVVTSGPQTGKVKFETFLGDPTQTPSTILSAAYGSDWGSTRRLDGIAYAVVQHLPVEAKKFASVFPQSYNTPYRFVVNGAHIWNPASGEDPDTWADWSWGDLSGDVILDFLRHRDGMRIALARIDVPSFSDFHDLCNESVGRVGTTDEVRYRCWGTYNLAEKPSDVLQRMCATCDGQLVQLASGKIGIRGGKWSAPVAMIGTKSIPTLEIAQGNDRLDAFNRLRVTYVDAENTFQSTELQAYQDTASQAEIGVIDQAMDLTMVPTFTQAARLAKIAFGRANPLWTGKIGAHLGPGLGLMGEATFTAEYNPAPDIGEMFNTDFTPQGFAIRGDGSGVDVDMISLSASLYDWDPATEEPPRPPLPTVIAAGSSFQPDDPTSVVLTMISVAVSGVTNAVEAKLAWDASLRDDVTPEAQIVAHGGSDWVQMSISADKTFGTYAPLTDGGEYDARVRFVANNGTESNWVNAASAIAVADPVAPDAPYGGSASPSGGGYADLVWFMPGSANVHDVVVKRGTTSTFAAATNIDIVNGAPNQRFEIPDSSVTIGLTYYYWFVARNASGVFANPGSIDGPHSVTIT